MRKVLLLVAFTWRSLLLMLIYLRKLKFVNKPSSLCALLIKWASRGAVRGIIFLKNVVIWSKKAKAVDI